MVSPRWTNPLVISYPSLCSSNVSTTGLGSWCLSVLLQDWRPRTGCSPESWRRGCDVLASDSTSGKAGRKDPVIYDLSVLGECARVHVCVCVVLQVCRQSTSALVFLECLLSRGRKPALSQHWTHCLWCTVSVKLTKNK